MCESAWRDLPKRALSFGSGTTKMLYQAVFRYLCRVDDLADERIFTQETTDPYSFEVELKDTSSTFTNSYLQSFREPLPEDQSKAMLQDRLSTGWLAWGKTLEVCRLTGPDEYDLYVHQDDLPGIEQIRPVIDKQEFWQTVSDCPYVRLGAVFADRLVDCRLLGTGRAAQPPLGDTYRPGGCGCPAVPFGIRPYLAHHRQSVG